MWEGVQRKLLVLVCVVCGRGLKCVGMWLEVSFSIMCRSMNVTSIMFVINFNSYKPSIWCWYSVRFLCAMLFPYHHV